MSKEQFVNDLRLARIWSESDMIPKYLQGSVEKCFVVLELARGAKRPFLEVAEDLSHMVALD